MADNLIFPIGFDLQKAVEEASQNWDKKYAKRLEQAIAKRPVRIKLEFEKLEDVKKRLAELKIQPITKETRSAIRELAKELQVLAKALEQVQKFSKTTQLGQRNFTNDVQMEKLRQANERLEIQKRRVALAEQKHAEAMQRSASKSKELGAELQKQEGYISRLIKRTVAYWSFNQVSTFLTRVRDVTAEFELQRVSLGAIIQDQNKANQLFSEIKTFALKSPISIIDLTKYTKQVAAYNIENDKLFDTTKRLADVSVGLGVDMGRLVLAFGQVKAASVLRSAEIRQFTEAGIPMLELLAEKFSELQGRAVSTEQVMKMVENRMVDFRMVEQIFTDLTSAGGMFYNMQEKQGNTLFGLWVKLGDVASVMYDEIGNTDEATYVMKGTIQLLTDLMHNWRFVGREALVVGATLMVLHTRMKLVSSNTKMAETATNSYTLAQRRLNAAQAGSMTAKAAEAAKRAAVANRAAAMSTNAWTAAKFRLVAVVNQLKAALLGNWVTLAIAAFAAIGMAIYSAYEKAHRLDNELNKIRSEGSVIQDQSVENFNRLAKAAVESANGSKQQRDALEELNRTYKDILPTDALKLENLRKLKGNYESLTQSVREYIAMQQKEKAINTIQEEYGGDIEKIRKTLHSRFTDKLGPWKMSEEQFSAFWAEFVKQSGDATKTFEQRLHAAFETTGKDAEEMMDKVALHTPTSNPFGENYLEKANRLLDEQRVKIEAESKAWDKAAGGLGKFYDKLEQAKKELSETRFISRGKNGEEVGVDKDTFLYQQMQANAAMKKAAQLIREDDTLKQAIQDKQVQLQPEWIHLVDSVNPNDLMNITYVNFDAIIKAVGDKYPDLTKRLEAIKKEWGNVVPNDGIVRLCQDRLSQIANGVKGGMDVMRQYLWNGSGTVDDYLKTLNNQITAMEAELFSAEQAVAKYGVVGAAINFLNGRSIGDVKEQLDGLRKMAEFVQTLVKPTETTSNEPTSTKSDNRLQNLQEIERTLTSINKKYEELTKTEGNTAALEYVRKNYDSTLKYINKLGEQFNLNFAMPTDFKDLQSYRKAIKDVIEQLKMKGHEKAAIELELKIAEGNQAQLQKEIQAKLKALADRISRTKTAKEFYEKIISTTGDYSLASKVAESIFGQNGSELRKALAEQVRSMAGDIPLPDNIISADNVIEYKALRQFAEANKNELGKMYDELIKISNDGQKDLAKTYEGYLKDLEKAKTYADKRVELARTTAEKIRNINADIAAGNIDEKVGKATIRGLQDREDKEAAKLEYEAFKDTPIYIQMFEDLEHASTTTLEMMKSRLESLSHVWGTALDPTQLKEVQSRMNEIDEQLRNRNPFKTLKSAYLDYKNAVESVSLQGAVANAGAASKEFYERSEMYGADSTQAKAAEKELKAREKIVGIARQLTDEQGKQLKGQQALDKAQKIALDNQLNANAALSIAAAEEQAMRDASKYENPDEDPKVIAAHEAVEKAKEEVNLAQRVSEIVQKNAKTSKTLKENLIGAANQVTQFMQIGADVAQAIGDTMEALGANEDDVQYFNDIATALGDITAGFQGIIGSALSLNVGGIISNAIGVIPNMVKGFVGLFTAGKVKRANKEIKRQQELLDQLEYTYGRLEKAADKLFGADFVANQKQQQKILLAQQQAYMKQYEAEMSKGKKADKEKAQEFLDKARDVGDQIADMQGKIAEQMAGTDVASAARDFASAWLEAYASFGNTTDAIREKFNDMIKNMIVESVMAKTVQMALQPMFDEMDKMYKSGASMTDVLSYAFSKAGTLTDQISNGLEVNAKYLESLGINIRDLYASSDNLKGIAKEVGSASSEEINQLSAFVNTALYYVSPIPTISDNVAVIRQLMERGTTSTLPDTTAAGWTDWQQQAMDNYNAIARNTADTVVECRRAANACEAATEKLNRALRAKGATIGFNVFLNS